MPNFFKDFPNKEIGTWKCVVLIEGPFRSFDYTFSYTGNIQMAYVLLRCRAFKTALKYDSRFGIKYGIKEEPL